MAYPLGSSSIPRVRLRRERWPGGSRLVATPLVSLAAWVEPDRSIIRILRDGRSQSPGPRTTGVLPALPGGPITRVLPALPGQQPTGVLPALPGSQPTGVLPTLPGGRLASELVLAGMRGIVVGLTGRGSVIIEGEAALVSGALGCGGQRVGKLQLWQAPRRQEARPTYAPGSLLVVPGPLNLAMLTEAVFQGLGGVIASSISSRDFERFTGVNLLSFLRDPRPDEHLADLPPLTLLLTEGLGTLAMPARTLELLTSHLERHALLCGLTSLRAGLAPELLLPLSLEEAAQAPLQLAPLTGLPLGALARVCSGSYEGSLGAIDYLFAHAMLYPSGLRARSARLLLADGSHLVVPLALLKRVG